MNASPRRRSTTASLLTIAQLGHAHWFFGNLYEAVAKIPERLADDPDLVVRGEAVSLTSLLRPGSPVRYYLPVAPVTVAASVSALIAGWDTPSDRRWLGASAVGTLADGLLTAYLVREINMKLFFAARPLAGAEREDLLRR